MESLEEAQFVTSEDTETSPTLAETLGIIDKAEVLPPAAAGSELPRLTRSGN